jgi:hypothetical protein
MKKLGIGITPTKEGSVAQLLILGGKPKQGEL